MNSRDLSNYLTLPSQHYEKLRYERTQKLSRLTRGIHSCENNSERKVKKKRSSEDIKAEFEIRKNKAKRIQKPRGVRNPQSKLKSLTVPAIGRQHSLPKKVLTQNRVEQRDEWLATAFNTFEQFKRLSFGWDTYNAPSPNSFAIKNAKFFTILTRFDNLRPCRIAPSVVGGIGITFRRGELLAYLEFHNDGATSLLLAQEPDEPVITPVGNDFSSYRDVGELIKGFLNE